MDKVVEKSPLDCSEPLGCRDRSAKNTAGLHPVARESAEKEIERVRNEYESVLNAISEGIHWVGLEGVIRFENPAAAKMLGYEISELLGQSAHRVMHHHRADGSEFPVHECPIYATLHDGITRHVENEVFWRKDGTSFAVEYTCTPTFDMTGRPNGSVVTFADATERKRFESAIQAARVAAEASSRAKSEFLGNMSHEFRTPLNGVIGMSEQLLATTLDLEQRTCADMIRISGESLLLVANNILDFSRIEAGKLTLDVADFDLSKVVDQAMDLLKAQAQGKGLNLATIVKRGVPNHVRGDAGRLRQILNNLLGNAVKFTSHGDIVLTVSPVTETKASVVLSFEVRDTGIGIEAAAQERLFEAFTQADGSNSRKYGGSGLGLAISKRLVELMKGKMAFKSVFEKGSAFTFEIELEKKFIEEESTGHKDLRGLHILIITDNDTDREILTGYTNAWAMRSECASNAHEAMKILRNSVVDDPYELAIMDIRMPGTEGLSLSRTISREPLLATVKLVAITPHDSHVEAAALKSEGIASFVLKPLHKDRLLNRLLETMTGSVVKRARQIALSGSLPKRYREVVKRKEIKILLAEDNRINQMVFLSLLQKLGYGASLAVNGVEVLKALDEDEYDLIFMDCQMPEMDGYEATRQIRKGTQHQPRIIAITANAMHGDDETCRGVGMDDYMSKPVRAEKLREMLDRWLPTGERLTGP